MKVSDIIPLSSNFDKSSLLFLVASAESKSEHPLGKGIVSHSKTLDITLVEPENFCMEAGKGIKAQIGEKDIICGNEKYLEENGIKLDNSIVQILESLRDQGKASVIATMNRECIGVIALSDMLRPDAKKW